MDKQVVKTAVGNIKFNNFALEDLEFLSMSPVEAIGKLLKMCEKQPLKALVHLIKAGRIGYEFEYGEELDFEADIKAIRKYVATMDIADYSPIMQAFTESVQVPAELTRIAENQPKGDPEKKSQLTPLEAV